MTYAAEDHGARRKTSPVTCSTTLNQASGSPGEPLARLSTAQPKDRPRLHTSHIRARSVRRRPRWSPRSCPCDQGIAHDHVRRVQHNRSDSRAGRWCRHVGTGGPACLLSSGWLPSSPTRSAAPNIAHGCCTNRSGCHLLMQLLYHE